MQPGVWFPRTKLLRPQPPDDLVVDDGLVDRVVTAATTVPLTVICAAAGSGKTTLAAVAAERIAGSAGQVGWIRFDELDDDATTVLGLLVAAFDGLVDGGCPGVRELLDAGLPASLDPRRAAGVLINDLLDAGGPDPAVVVLDDLHTIGDPGALAVLDYFVGHLPPTVHLLVTTRSEPGLSMPQLRVRRQVAELGDDDLLLDVAQAERLLNDRLHHQLDTDAVAGIVAATGGWVTGVRLHGGDPAELDGYIDDELVAMEADDVVTFLVESSILDVLTPDACVRVTGRPDAADLLGRLHRRFGLFISVVDPAVPSYRLHDLFAQHLRNRLAKWPPSRLTELHLSAAGIVESPARQIEHLLTAGDWDAAAERIDQMMGRLPRPAELSRLVAWADQLPPSAQEHHPGIAIILGTEATQHGNFDRAIPLLEHALAQLDDHELDRRWLVVRSLHLATNDHARFEPMWPQLEADPAFATLPAAARADHHISRAYGAMFAGAWDAAAQRVTAAVGAATASADPGAIEVLAQHLSPTLVGVPGYVDALEAYTAWAEEHVPDGLLLGRLGLHHQRAILGFVQGRFDQAVRDAAAARPLIERLGGLPYLRATTDWVLAGVAHAAGDDAEAERVLRVALDPPEPVELDRELDVARLGLLARVLRRSGRVEDLPAVVARIAAHDGSRYPVFAASCLHSARAQAHLAVGELDEAIEALREAVAVGAAGGAVPFLVVPQIDLALALEQAGQRREALDELAAAARRVRAWGAPGLLAAAGAELVPLLQELGESPAPVAASPAPVPIPGTSEVLSPREVEVLRLLASGATNAQIAEALIISAHTAKTHVSHILTKLDARTRGEAVARARDAGLI